MNVDANPRRGFDKTRESEANTAGFEITASGRNPKGKMWNEVNILSNPSLSLEWGMKAKRSEFAV